MTTKEISHSEIKDGKCSVNVNYSDDRTGECLSSEQYKGSVGITGNVARIEKTGQSK